MFSRLERYYMCEEFAHLKRAEEKEYKSAVNPFCKRYVYSPVKKRRRSRTDF